GQITTAISAASAKLVMMKSDFMRIALQYCSNHALLTAWIARSVQSMRAKMSASTAYTACPGTRLLPRSQRLAVLSSQPVRATRNSLVFRGAAMRARSRKEILSRGCKEFLGAILRLEKFDGTTVRSVDSSTMKHSLLSYNQNESAGMSHMPRESGKSLSRSVLLQVDAELSCNVELNTEPETGSRESDRDDGN